jgi:hypothetical protein
MYHKALSALVIKNAFFFIDQKGIKISDFYSRNPADFRHPF